MSAGLSNYNQPDLNLEKRFSTATYICIIPLIHNYRVQQQSAAFAAAVQINLNNHYSFYTCEQSNIVCVTCSPNNSVPAQFLINEILVYS